MKRFKAHFRFAAFCLWLACPAFGAGVMNAGAIDSDLVKPAVASPRPQVWQRWEHALTSTLSYTNPYADVTLRVTYTGPGGRTLRAFGFWDGANTFRIRCAFPIAGAWQWETACSDTSNSGLHRQRGTINVTPYEGANTLYQRGFLKVSDNRRYLVYGNGTPFLWLGDTAWAVPQRATDEEWAAYLADRVAKHFTVIQVGPASEWAGPTNRAGEKPFTDKTCSQWNPAYWQSFDQKVQRANEAGLTVLLVGLMEPVHRYPGTNQACLFARNIVARLFGNFVIFSPSFDSNFMPLANEVGRAAREATAVHLITQHPGTPWNQPTPTFSVKYYDEPYLDIAAVQTGHNGGHLDWCAHHAIEWNLQLYRHEPHKPVINLEAMYDAQGEKDWRAVDARSLAWRTLLSGAMGYTYGAGDLPPKVPKGNGAIWKWVTDPAKYDYWKKALQWDSAFQMQHLHDFLAALEWWRLEPAHDLIRNQPEDITRRMVLAKTATGDLAVAYLPNNDAIEVNLSAFPAALSARWFDPVQGRYTPIADRVENKGVQRFTPPAKGDWVLLFTASAAEPPTQNRPLKTSMVFPGKDWDPANPQSQGVDSAKLKTAMDYLERGLSDFGGAGTVFIVRNGHAIWQGPASEREYQIYSATKSFTSAMLGLLIEDGKVSLNTLAKDFEPALAAQYPAVTIRHFTTMTSGYDSAGGSYEFDREGRGDSWNPGPPAAPLFPPGAKFRYWDDAMMQFGNVLTKAAGQPLNQLFKARIADPIGMTKWRWTEHDTPTGRVLGWTGSLRTSSQEMARFGHLFLNRGNWQGRQLISTSWVNQATSVQVPPTIPNDVLPRSRGAGVYGYNWWVNGIKPDGQRLWPGAPPRTYYANGLHNNVCIVVPEWNLVIARSNGARKDGSVGTPPNVDEIWSGFFSRLAEAISPAPLQPQTQAP